MTQKVLKVGSSAAVTIPKEALVDLQWKIGDRVTVEKDTKRGGLVILPVRKGKIDAEVLDWTDNFIKKYRPALEALANKK
ncbi:MAG: AbrB/MazE/SpoVT family DNA-binding domain-containing protein [Patescibacteria group bacterium]|jgi:putative addiction module antidote